MPVYLRAEKHAGIPTNVIIQQRVEMGKVILRVTVDPFMYKNGHGIFPKKPATIQRATLLDTLPSYAQVATSKGGCAMDGKTQRWTDMKSP